MHLTQHYSLILAIPFAAAAGLVGSFAFMKRMLLASDVISHLALPGLGIAFLLKINPLVGGAASLLLGTLLIWRLEQHTGLAIDAMIGVVFAAALAIGALVTPNEDLLEALFGVLWQPSLLSLLVGTSLVAFIGGAIFLLRHQLTLAVFSPELAAATGVNVRRLDLYFLSLFSLTVLIGLRFTGALLGSVLIIVPAATARRLFGTMSHFVIASCVVSVFSVAVGWLFSTLLFRSSPPGATIAIVSTILFAFTLLRRPA